jgi:predicted alpha/beta hydrolase family esterase
MKNAILLHGTDGSDHDYFWFADTQQYLESKGYSVWWPLLPGTAKPELNQTKDFIFANSPIMNETTIIIGHSSACPVILSVLEHLAKNDVVIDKAILVAGMYLKGVGEGVGKGYSDPVVQDSYDSLAIKKACKSITIINSDNDPWHCDDAQARAIALSLDSTFIIPVGKGHMGSNRYNDSCPSLDIVKRLI